MEKSMKRENILLEYSSQIAARNSPQTPHRSSETDDMDFNDVFGGPPRRFSMQEARVKYSYGETVESEEEISQWALLKEKPVFGDEIVARRRRQGNDFYDDIFGGDEPQNSPRKTDRDKDSVFGSNPSSRIMSPARSFTPKPEPSLPAQFSFPSKLTKAVDHPVFGSRNNNSSGLKSPHSPSNSLSRFSNQASRSQNQIRNELHQSVLSREASLSSEEDSPFYEKGKTEKLKKETKIMDQFHFSIYKWAGSGVPMLVMPLMGRNNLKPKDSSGNYDKEIDHVESESITVTRQGFSAEFEKKDLKIKEVVKEVQNSKGAVHKIPESKSESKAKNTVGLVEATKILKSKKFKSVDEVVAKEKVYGEKPETVKDFLKSEEVGKIVTKERTIGTANGAYSSDHSIKNVEKHAGPGIDSERQNVGKPNLQDGRTSSGTSTNKSGIKGKVKGFVQIFNQEGDSKPKVDFQELSQSFRSKTVGIGQKESEVSSNAANVEESLNLHNVNKKPDVSPKVDENVKDKAQQYSSRNSTSNRYNDFPTKQKNNAVTPEPLNRNSGILVDYPDDASEDNFLVEELFDDLDKHTQSGAEVSDDMKALDAKIQQWSVGKKGNIRSLLSTLQYVLWAESGWTAVPLVDLIEGNSVKRAYQKALLRLHPDKLQQKGAADSHKYIAQKVFDILQEAWDHFNTLAPL